jgi:hypothetical protein
MSWITPRRFQEVCEEPQFFVKEFEDLKAFVLKLLEIELTEENWQDVYRLYCAQLNLEKTRYNYDKKWKDK